MSERFVGMDVVHGWLLPVEAREGAGFPGTAIGEDCEPPDVGAWYPQPQPSAKEQEVL